MTVPPAVSDVTDKSFDRVFRAEYGRVVGDRHAGARRPQPRRGRRPGRLPGAPSPRAAATRPGRAAGSAPPPRTWRSTCSARSAAAAAASSWPRPARSRSTRGRGRARRRRPCSCAPRSAGCRSAPRPCWCFATAASATRRWRRRWASNRVTWERCCAALNRRCERRLTVRHLSEGALRRLHDDRFAVSNSEREHLGGCDRCRRARRAGRGGRDARAGACSPARRAPAAGAESALARLRQRRRVGRARLPSTGLPRRGRRPAPLGAGGGRRAGGRRRAGGVGQRGRLAVHLLAHHRWRPVTLTAGSLNGLPDLSAVRDACSTTNLEPQQVAGPAQAAASTGPARAAAGRRCRGRARRRRAGRSSATAARPSRSTPPRRPRRRPGPATRRRTSPPRSTAPP